ncbi:hypothetical protein C8J57DRAFT_1507459 [Mycena rebaudengoi]|nr:hypothetical protein C8J57DRAFT_1507459 [Mycena rebaudengoi]
MSSDSDESDVDIQDNPDDIPYISVILEIGDAANAPPADPYLALISLFPVDERPLRPSLPAETWTEIFDQYCLLQGSTPRAYVAARRDLCNRHPLFARFVLSSPTLWRMISMTAHTPSARVAFAVDRVQTAPLDIDIFLSAVTMPRLDDPAYSAPYTSFLDNTRAGIALLATKAHLWRNVRFVATSIRHGRLLHRVLETAATPIISSFEIVLPSFPLTLANESVAGSPTLFPLSIPVLRVLSTHHYSLPWTSAQPFSQLQMLTLGNTPAALHPTALQFSRFLQSAASLHTLSVTGPFMLRETADYSYTPCLVPFLTTLHINGVGLSSEKSLATFLCSLDSPNLRNLRLSNVGTEFTTTLAAAPLIRRITNLAMMASDRWDEEPNEFILGFESVVDIDLQLVGPYFFESLAVNPAACHELKSLALGPVDIFVLHEYLIERCVIARPIENLTLNHGLGTGAYLTLHDVEILRFIYSIVPATVTIPSLVDFLG